MEEAKTLGGRIQAHRKAAGLSQEALGERLGVSRQAVSRWEADAAVPELEKLIAMSRLFAVTVGTLLGVEPPAGEAGPAKETRVGAASAVNGGAAPDGPSTAPELSGRELAAAEAIAEKYLASFRPRWSRNRKLAAAAALCALVLAISLCDAFLWGQLLEVRQELSSLKASTYQQAQSAAGKTDIIMSENDNIFHDFTIQVTDYDLEAQTLTLRAGVQAKAWEADTACVFTAILSDGQQFQADALRQEGACSVEDWVLPMDGEIRLSAALTTAGASASQPLAKLINCQPEDFQLEINCHWDAVRHSGTDPLHLDLKGLRLDIRYPDNTFYDYPITYAFHAPTALDLCFYRNERTAPELVLPMEEVLDDLTQAQSAECFNDPDYRASFDLAPEETLVSALRVRDDRGDTFWYVVGTFQNRGGTLLSKPFLDQAWDGWQPGSFPQA